LTIREGDPPSPSGARGLPLPLAAVTVERVEHRGRSRDELAREPAPDDNVRLLRLWAYEAFDTKFTDGYPRDGPSWDDIGDLVDVVQRRAAQSKVDYGHARDAVEHVCRIRAKGIGGPDWPRRS
jgi:hypothetical protein